MIRLLPAILLLIVGLYFVVQPLSTAEGPATPDLLTITTPQNTQHVFLVEVARTPDELSQGLMFRQHLSSDKGMLFLFPEPRIEQFWMKNTLVPLDILFIDRDGVIIDIHPMAQPHDLTLITSKTPVLAGLEIAGGQAQERGISVGSRISSSSWAEWQARFN